MIAINEGYKKIDPFADTETVGDARDCAICNLSYKKIDPFADTETFCLIKVILSSDKATKKSIRLRILKRYLYDV